MAAPDDVSPFDPRADSEAAVGSNLGLLEEAARSIRRIEANEAYDDEGIRTIWHRGRVRTEILSWEDREGNILKQELSMFGMVLEYQMGSILRTGQIPMGDQTTGSGKPMAHLVQMDASPSRAVLEYASHLLKNVPGRDFYSQHLLKHVNATISFLGMDPSRTSVSDDFRGFSKEKESVATVKLEGTADAAGDERSSRNTKLIVIAVLLALLGIAAGAAVGFLIK